MEYKDIKQIAEKYKNILTPFCKKICIAGSIRRKKSEVRDIEIVVVVKPEMINQFADVVDQWKRVKGNAKGKYTQRLLEEGVKLDLFIAKDDNFGNILLQRTGSWKFSRYMLGIRTKQYGYVHKMGFLWKDSQKVPCYTEEDVFKVLNVKYIQPEEREW